jgi:hypothetical protein
MSSQTPFSLTGQALPHIQHSATSHLVKDAG